MAKHNIETVMKAVLEADAALVVLTSIMGDKPSPQEQTLLTTARQKLEIATARLNDVRRLVSDTLDAL